MPLRGPADRVRAVRLVAGYGVRRGEHPAVQPVGVLLALFYVAIFPGNISQYVNGISAFGLDTDQARFIRLFFQPVLIAWALWSTDGVQKLKEWRNRYCNKRKESK